MDTEARLDVDHLLVRAKAGASDCLGRLFQHYGNYLKLLAATHIDEKLHARCSPSDVVQDTYCEAHRDFQQFRGRSGAEFLAWLRQILVNNMARAVEKHILAAKRDVRREVHFNAITQAMEQSAIRLESVLADDGTSPSSGVDRHERAVVLANYLTELPADYRKVLMLRHCEGLSFNNIALRMGRSSGAVRMLWLRAIGRIREKLGEGGQP
jgi:RNA polymerase sigma-70 factor, ECF subfamily